MNTMEFINFVIFVCVAITITYGVTESVLLSVPRMLLASRSRWLEILLYCALCSGFWSGALAGAIAPGIPGPWWFRMCLGAFVTPGVIALIRVMTQNDFLPGAQHERPYVQRIRDGISVDEPSSAAESGADDADASEPTAAEPGDAERAARDHGRDADAAGDGSPE